MSQQRRARRQQREGTEGPAVERNWKLIAIIAVIVAIAAGVGGFYYYRDQHKYDAFARCLGDRGLKMYGAFWCPHCKEQKALFRASFKYAPYVECGIEGNASGGQTQVCKDAGIKH